MCWGVSPGVPANSHSAQTPMPPLISRELLRTVCEPFFEQMITALQHALQEQMLAQQQCPDTINHAMKNALANQGCLQPWSCLDPTFDEESTEADDFGAFASLLSGCPSEADTKSPETDVVAPLSLEYALPEEPEQSSDLELELDSEKSSMVCRHWKTKGWCRMESNCKFLHPEHKRGVAAPGGISRATCPGMSTGESEMPVAALARRKKRGGKNRSNKGVPADVPNSGVSQLPGYSVEPDVISFHCTSFV